MWQALFDDLKNSGFVILAVAMDQPEAAKPWIDAAAPKYPCLIDRDHHIADLYNMVNVPQAVWIDEAGRIVRPPETAGSTDGFRQMDRSKFVMPDAAVAERDRLKSLYLEAVRDWAIKGSDSAHVLNAQQTAARLKKPDPAIAQAHTLFRLGQYLLRAGHEKEATTHFAAAIKLHPDSWNMFRQTLAKDPRGLASGPEFWARVDALGGRPYYAPIQIEGA